MLHQSKKTKLLYIPLALLAVICLLPFLIMVANATKTDLEIATSISLLPGGFFVENIKTALNLAPLGQGLLNSAYVAIFSTLLSIYFSTLVAYGFSTYKFKGNKVLFYIVLLTMMIPGQLTFLGFYDMIKGMGLLNTYWPLILPGIANAGNVFFLKQYCDQTVSHEIIESARIDGYGELAIYHKIIMPMLKPAMATMSIFTFIGSWNNYLTPLLILNDVDKYTLPVMLRYISGTASVSSVSVENIQGAIYASAMISVIPIFIIFLIFSKQIVGGLNAGSVKG